VPYHFGRFIYVNLSKGLFKDFFSQFEGDTEQSKLGVTLFEVLSMYIQLYNNLELRINDSINAKRLTPKQAIDVLASYSIAQEGTNTLYLGLTEVVMSQLEKDENQDEILSLHEIEMLLNYFPHSIWQQTDVDEVQKGKEKFYFPLVYKIDQSWEMMSNDSFLAIVQGLVLAGNSIMKE